VILLYSGSPHGCLGFIQPRVLPPADTVRFQAGLATRSVIPDLVGDPSRPVRSEVPDEIHSASIDFERQNLQTSFQPMRSLLPRLNTKKILITLVRQGKNTPISRWGLEISRQLRSAKLFPQASFLRRQEPTCGSV